MTEQEYEVLVDLFESDGWKVFIGSVTDLEEAIVKAAPDSAMTNDQWQFARGQITQLRNILGYENYIKLSFNNQGEYDE